MSSETLEDRCDELGSSVLMGIVSTLGPTDLLDACMYS